MNTDWSLLVPAALMILAVSVVLLVCSALPLFFQASRTLLAYENLARTLETELTPTLIEIKDVMAGDNQIRSSTAQRVSEVSHQVEGVAGSVADEAKKHSQVWGTGLIAGLKAYLTKEKENV